MRLTIRSGAAALAFLAIVLATAACSHEKAARDSKDGEPVRAATLTARAEEIPDILSLTGTLQPLSRVMLASKVMGRIRKVAVKEGDAVRTGQLLVKIDDADMQAAVAQAEGALEAAIASEANASVHRDRIRDLESRQAATRKNREDAEMAYAVASAQRRQAESAISGAKAMLAYATLVSPVTGIIAAKHAEEGSMASPGMPLLTLEETSRMKVEAALPESEAASVRAGSPVDLSFDAGGVGPRRSSISEVLPSADPATRTLLIRIFLDNADGALRSGSFARVAAPRGTRRAVLVPSDAIVRRGALTGLFVAAQEGGTRTARLRWIRAGEPAGDRVEVLSGLADGDEYVAHPPPSLADGSPLEKER